MRKTGSKWDSVPYDGITVEMLDQESFDIFRREALRTNRLSQEDLDCSNEELLDKMGLLVDGKLKRAAILLFYRHPERLFTGAYVKIGKFGDGPDLLYEDTIEGSLMIMADRAIDTIYLKYLKAAISYDKDVRVETYSFPEGWTVQNLLKPHKSVPFNPDIANAFYKAGYIETWGRGIEKIISACREIGAKDPEYEVEFGDITIRFEAIALDYTSDKASDKALSEALNDALNEEERRILKAIIEQPRMSQEELVEKTGYSRSKIQRKMKQLKNKGFIYRAGAKKNGAWVVAGVTEEN